MHSYFSPFEESLQRRSGAEDGGGRDCRDDWLGDVVAPLGRRVGGSTKEVCNLLTLGRCYNIVDSLSQVSADFVVLCAAHS